jgi:hypothetical protein
MGQVGAVDAASLPGRLSTAIGGPSQDGKLELGKLRGGKMDDITVVCAYVAPVEGS